MSRVGILTYHDLNNYGAQLQATATQRFLEANGHDAELIDFRPARRLLRLAGPIVRSLVKFDAARTRKELAKRAQFRNSIFETARVSKQSAFTEQRVAKLAANYDVLVCGSDELWNFGNYLGYCGPYILDFGDAVKAKRISYAASVGSFMPKDQIADRMRASLGHFGAIMVRDFQTQQVVEQLGCIAERVLDPTFIADLPSAEVPTGRYMMITGGMPAAVAQKAAAAARMLGLEVKCVGYSYAGLDDTFVDATPAEWVAHIRGAACHVTTLFHGCALSIKYGVPFAARVPKGKMQKMGALLQIFESSDRVFDETVSPEILAGIVSAPLAAAVKVLLGKLTQQSQAALLRAVAV